jgi:hypothetical protein
LENEVMEYNLRTVVAVLTLFCSNFRIACNSIQLNEKVYHIRTNTRGMIQESSWSCARNVHFSSSSIAVSSVGQSLIPEHYVPVYYLQILRVRGGRVKMKARIDEENERVAGLALKRLKQNPFCENPDTNFSHAKPKINESEFSELDLLDNDSRRRAAVNARSLLWNLVQRTALAIVLPDELWPKIQAVRLKYDRWVNRWFHPVMVLFNPFFPIELLGEAAEAMQSSLRYSPPLDISLHDVVVCAHSASFSLRLIPGPETRTALQCVRDKLVALFPTLVVDGNNGFCGDSAPHLILGQFSSNREAETVADSLRNDGFLPIRFKADELMVMAREEEPDGRENRASGRAPFDCLRSVVLGMGADAVEPGPISEAEANLDASDEPEAVVQEWNPKTCRFENVRGGEFEELEKKRSELSRTVRQKRAEKMEDKERDFFKDPSRQAEAQRATIPAALVANMSAALRLVDEPGGDGSVLTSFVREYRRRNGVSLTSLAADLGFGGVSQLLRAMPDIIRLSRRRADLFVHRVIPQEEKQRTWRASALKRELAAMKGRDATEASAARGTNRRIRAAETRVMQRFARRVGADDAALVEEYGYKLVDEARSARFGRLRADPDSPYYDLEAVKFAAALDAERSGGDSNTLHDGSAGSGENGEKDESGWATKVASEERAEEQDEKDVARKDRAGFMDSGSDPFDAQGTHDSVSEIRTRAMETALKKRLNRRRGDGG